MPTPNVRKLRLLTALIFSATLFAAHGVAQDDEELPTPKLDRVPAAPAFSGQTRAPAASRSIFKVESLIAGL